MSGGEEHATEFVAWSHRWTWAPPRQQRDDEGAQPGVGVFSGPTFDDEDERIETVLALWRELATITYHWQREMSELLTSRQDADVRRRSRDWHYVRGDHDSATRSADAPEHELEWNVLQAFQLGLESLGARVVDAVNAVPLTKVRGGRSGNVEIDVVFLVEDRDGYSLQLVEAKQASNNAWFAVVEALRQLALFQASTESSVVRQLMCARNPELGLQADGLSATSVVLAPLALYTRSGQKANSEAPARALIRRAREELGAACELAVWDEDARTITPYEPGDVTSDRRR